ncbi:MAG: biotin--[acetyl-CoA-carboxylase] ligase [Oscillospiraceae bacterium]|jgi:BirA family biotin operon repressor/biotin-[acetyl-CoA-carboxylase] ligase|nr:biotin--[acetyl-CoA-carboxylase] ligase [Oscillospiraceae bacterium]
MNDAGAFLSENEIPLSENEIRKALGGTAAPLYVKRVTGSANDDAAALARSGAPEGTLVAAAEQTSGRGRNGRAYYCPAGSGVYFSVILRPERPDGAALTRVTPYAAVAVCRAVEEVCGASAEIKWVNDIIVRGKKVAGILAEAHGGAVILGVGVNVAVPDGGFIGLPGAGAVTDAPPRFARERIAGVAVRQFFELYRAADDDAVLEEYRSRSAVIGRAVTAAIGGAEETVFAAAIDGEFRLVIRRAGGETLALGSGEIRVKLQ